MEHVVLSSFAQRHPLRPYALVREVINVCLPAPDVFSISARRSVDHPSVGVHVTARSWNLQGGAPVEMWQEDEEVDDEEERQLDSERYRSLWRRTASRGEHVNDGDSGGGSGSPLVARSRRLDRTAVASEDSEDDDKSLSGAYAWCPARLLVVWHVPGGGAVLPQAAHARIERAPLSA